MSSARLEYPATRRNREPILEVLTPLLADGARVLEIACGSGEHAAYFAARFPAVTWIASDVEARARASAAAWAEHHGAVNLSVTDSDATLPPWQPDGSLDLIINVNMIHIAAWAACQGLMRGAAAALEPNGRLFMYGPYIRDGVETAPSNLEFDASLRQRNPEWGVRHLSAVAAEAALNGLELESTVEMPANNLSVIYRRA